MTKKKKGRPGEKPKPGTFKTEQRRQDGQSKPNNEKIDAGRVEESIFAAPNYSLSPFPLVDVDAANYTPDNPQKPNNERIDAGRVEESICAAPNYSSSPFPQVDVDAANHTPDNPPKPNPEDVLKNISFHG